MDSDRLRVGVVGTGYLGATHAICMAELGCPVIGMDVDAAKVSALADGRVPFYEPGLAELLARNLSGGGLRFTTSYREVAGHADVLFVCVGTPQRRDGYAADLGHLDAAFDGLLPHLDHDCLVVGKSTVPAGTAERLADRVAREAPGGPAVRLAWNPEFLREGWAVEDTLKPDRLVFGVRSPGDEALLRLVYRPVIDAGAPVVVCDFATAQLVKTAANAFLATKISFINAMAEVCEAVHGDVVKLSEALAHDTRIGGRFLHAGLGFGGGCLPKDIRAFMARAEELGVRAAVDFLRDVDEINLRRRARMVELTREVVGGELAGTRAGVLGASFKPNSDDIRDSPALVVAASLHDAGAAVSVYDPVAMPNARRDFPQLRYADSVPAAVDQADVVLHLTEWREFREMAPEGLAGLVRHRRIVDGRNALDPQRWRAAGWVYRALGRP